MTSLSSLRAILVAALFAGTWLTVGLPSASPRALSIHASSPPRLADNRRDSAAKKSLASWRSFCSRFSAALKKRDRAALKSMMLSTFISSFGNDPGPDAAFKYWDDPHVRGWAALEKTLSKGFSKSAQTESVANGKPVVGRSAPPEAMKPGYKKWRAIFEFGTDHRWRFAAFVQGD